MVRAESLLDPATVLQHRGVPFVAEAMLAALLGVAAATMLLSPWRASHDLQVASRLAEARAAAPTLTADITVLQQLDAFHRQTVETQAAPVQEAAPATALDLTLNGANADDDDPTRGSAFITGPNNQQKRYRVGDEVLPGVVLREVYRHRVLLERADGSLETLPFANRGPTLVRVEDAGDFDAAPKRVLQRADAGQQPDAAWRDADAVAGAPAAEPTSMPPAVAEAVSSALGAAGAADVDPMAMFAAVNPQPRTLADGRRGLALTNAGDPQMFASLGVEPGDVLMSVNGYSLATRQEALAAALALEQADRLSFLVSRDGTDFTVTVDVD